MTTKLRLTIFVLFIFLFTACGQSAPNTSLLASQSTPISSQTAAALQAPQYHIALVMKTLTNPFFVEMEKGARLAENEFDFRLIVKTGAQETSVEQQITIIEELIQDRVDAILIAPADSVQLIPVLKKAQDAGIVIINIDNQLDQASAQKAGLVNMPYISVDNEQGAYLSARYISQNVNLPVQAVILEGIPTARNAQDRKTGAMRAFAENPNIQVVASESANWKIDEAYLLTVKLFEQYPDIKLVFCANDMMAFGVVRYLEEKKLSDVQVAAYDALAQAMPMLHAGTLHATIDQQAAMQAYTGIQYALRSLDGETLPPITLLDVILVTRANAK